MPLIPEPVRWGRRALSQPRGPIGDFTELKSAVLLTEEMQREQVGYFSHLAAAGCKTHVNAQARYTRRVVFYIFCPRVTNGVHLWRGEVLRSCGQVQRVCIDFIQIKAVWDSHKHSMPLGRRRKTMLPFWKASFFRTTSE